MARYEELLSNPRFAKLKPVPATRLVKLRAERPGLPAEYEDFLRELGAGQVGSASFMIYDGLVNPSDIHGDRSKELQAVLLFGDDFQGYSFGFAPSNKWRIVEVDPIDGSVAVVAESFEEFVRRDLT
jgi:hypothetical protein